MTAALSPLVSWALVLGLLSWIALAAAVVALSAKLRQSRALNDAWSYSLRRQRAER